MFAIATSGNIVKLYDLRTFDQGPFVTFVIKTREVDFTGMKFSPDGKYILLSTSENLIFLIDSFEGHKLQEFATFVNRQNSTLEASFSPDSQFVLSGSEDGKIYIWSTQSGAEVTSWEQGKNAVNCVKWNPKSCMVASSCQKELAFWILPPSDDQ